MSSSTNDDDATVSAPRAAAPQSQADDEATRVDAKKPAPSDDDEATQARPPPPQAIAVYKEKQALAKMGPAPKKRVHPLVALGAGLLGLALILLLLNALRAGPADGAAEGDQPGMMHRLFN